MAPGVTFPRNGVLMVIGSMTMNPDTTKPDGAVGATALAANPYGYYDPSSREYVITRPDTPTPWINYLGQGRYGGIISNTAGGFSFDRDPRDRRVSRYRLLPAGLDENGSASFAEDGSACLHADAKRRRLMTAVTDRRAPKCFL